MRTRIVLTLVSWLACSAAIIACCGSYHYCSKDDEVEAAFHAAVPVSNEEGPFRHDWMLSGVEEFTAIGLKLEDKSSPKSESDSDVRDQLYTGMWSAPPYNGHGILVDGGCYMYFVAPSTVPPFDSGWLADAVWPRTRMFLVGAAVKPDALRYAISDECL